MRSRLTVVDEELGTREGTDVVTFLSTERWRRDLDVTGYREVAVFLGDNMYRTRSLRFTPPSLRADIAGSLRNLPETLGYKVLRVFNHKINDIESRCAYLEERNDKPAEVTWCFNAQTELPTARLSGSGNRRIEFSNYKPFGSKFVPGNVEVIVDGKQKGSALIEAIDLGITVGAHTFDPPTELLCGSGAITCKALDQYQSGSLTYPVERAPTRV